MKGIQSICLLICMAACSPAQDFPDVDTLPSWLEQESWPGLQFGQDVIFADLTDDGLYRMETSRRNKAQSLSWKMIICYATS